MPSPSTSLATLRPSLASFFEYDLEAEKAGYVATKVFPVVEVDDAAGTFGRITLEQLLKQVATERNSNGGYAQDDFTFEEESYATREHGVEGRVDDNLSRATDKFFNHELIVTMRAYAKVLRNAEQRMAAKLFNPSVWTGAEFFDAPTHEWDDAENGVPLTDVEKAVRNIYNNSGLWANALVINRKVFRNLRSNNQIIERIESAGAGKPSSAGDVTAEMLAAAFDLEHVIVAGASKNSANEGQAASPAQIWSDEYAMVCRVSTSVDMSDPCIGRTFHWSADGSSIGGTVESYRDEVVRSDKIRVRHQIVEQLLYKEAGYLIGNVSTIA